MDATLGRYPVSVSIPVAWGEMDAFQHVNNVVYARWLVTARMVYLERIGLVDRMRNEGIGRLLLFRCLATMLTKGFHCAWFLWTGKDAARLYSLAGFRQVRQFAVMKRDLCDH